MPDRRQHRGPHPQDREQFARTCDERLRAAASDLSWLLTRGYSIDSSLKLVGDRYQLTARQRLAVSRCACSDEELKRRTRHEVSPAQLSGQRLWIDGYNLLTTIEAALSGGVILHARDGCYRDMASMHGSYRKVEETIPAIHRIGETLTGFHPSICYWLLDAPVSNSRRLKTMLGQIAAERSWNWQIELLPDPDPVLAESEHVVASADSQILNKAKSWFNLARLVVDSRCQGAWVIDLSC